MSIVERQFPDIILSPLVAPAQHPGYNYDGFNPSVQTLTKGYTKEPGRRPFGVDTVFEKDVAVKLRDGVKIYTDIFRPATSDNESGKVPAIIPWSPYGKSGRGECFITSNSIFAKTSKVPKTMTPWGPSGAESPRSVRPALTNSRYNSPSLGF